MAKKFFKKALSVGLSLALCASLVAPAFAHTVTIDGVDDSLEVDTVQAGVNAIASSESQSGSITMTEDANENVTVGGGLDVTLDLNGNTITGTGAGSVVQVNGSDLTIEDSSDKKSGTITGGNAVTGGGVYVENGNLTLNGGAITGNNAAEQGGGVFVKGDSKVTMNEGAEISYNGAGFTGGGVFVYNYTDKDNAQFEMNGGKITENVAGPSGNTSGAGGGIGAYGYKDKGAETAVVINGGEIKDNTTNGNGGGIAVQNNAIKINGAEISGNTANSIGGGIYLSNSNTTITGSEITENHADVKTSATNGGGGIYAGGGTVNISGTKISDNTSTKNGGGISGDAAMNLDGVTINGNTATGGGGGMYITNSKGNVNVTNTEISDNTAGGAGGGIYSSNGTLTMDGGEISGNTATQGGGIYAQGGSNVTMEKGEISGNTATNVGGGVRIHGNGTTFTMNDGSITKNHAGGATTGGGGVYSYNGSTFTMNGGEITGNTATGHGAGVFNHTANFTMIGGKIYGNRADGSSDDIYSNVSKGGSVTLTTAEEMNVDNVDRWLWDVSSARVEKDNSYDVFEMSAYDGKAILRLKAAQSQHFQVTVSDGYSDTPILNKSLERNTAFPQITDPVRPGYNFAGWNLELPKTVNGEINLVAQWEAIPDDEPPADTGEIDIDDPATPLASGPVTRAQFVDYLWRHEGEPAPVADSGLFEDVTEENEYSPAMAWAKSIGIIEGYEDGTFEPDELVTVSAVRDILTRFAAYADMTMPEMTTLTGSEDEAVLNCDEVLAEFFGEEYAPAEDSDIEIAA